MTNISHPELRRKVRSQFMGAILAAFGLVVGLAWNDAIKAFIEFLFPLGHDTLLPKFIYAIIVTLFVAIISYVMMGSMSEDAK